MKTLLLLLSLLLTSLGTQAQLRAERKALRVFTHRIRRHVNVRDFYENQVAYIINYDGTVAPAALSGWDLPSWHKDWWRLPRRHWVMRYSKPGASSGARERQKIRRSRRFRVYRNDFEGVTTDEGDGNHDLRQRDSLAVEHLPVRAPLRRVPSAAYRRHLTPDSCGAVNYLTVHRALVGRRYVMVGVVLGCTADCGSRRNVPVVVMLRKRTLRLVDWWYIVERMKD